MAEFSEVMKQWNRMCNSMQTCYDCEIYKSCLRGMRSSHEGKYDSEGIAAVETVVMQWAADNPEPDYPTWGEWLKDRIGITTLNGFPTPDQVCDIIMHTYISADDAKKLGIEPKKNI